MHLASASPGVPVPCKELARAGRMPERFLLQILRSLVTHGLLQSTRGVDGGYYLSREATQITVRDIVEAFDNSLESVVPVLDGFTAGTRTRLLTTLQMASQRARQELQKVSIADLLACNHGVDGLAIVPQPIAASPPAVNAAQT
jgi:Rrf2 family protein